MFISRLDEQLSFQQPKAYFFSNVIMQKAGRRSSFLRIKLLFALTHRNIMLAFTHSYFESNFYHKDYTIFAPRVSFIRKSVKAHTTTLLLFNKHRKSWKYVYQIMMWLKTVWGCELKFDSNWIKLILKRYSFLKDHFLKTVSLIYQNRKKKVFRPCYGHGT